MKYGMLPLLALAVVLLLSLAACDPAPTPTATPTVATTPNPTPTPDGALPDIPSLGPEDKFGVTIRIHANSRYELSVFATADDLAKVFDVTVRFPDDSLQYLQQADDSWRYLETGVPATGTYRFMVALKGGTSFEKTLEYAGERP
jgi:hypothetical protein